MVGMQRVHRARSEVERWLRVREREGVSFAELARRSGIPFGTLANWSRRLRLSATTEAGQGFVQVVATDEASRARDGEQDVITLRLSSGARIELRGRFAEHLAAQLKEQLGSWC
jgi:transcriptional regulator with XRE-family HTH domain